MRHQQYSGVQVQALRKRWRRNDDLEHTLGKQRFQFAKERAWQTPMMNRHAQLEASDRRVLITQPLLSNFECSLYRRFVVEQGRQVSTTV